jgi:hypothetical protein
LFGKEDTEQYRLNHGTIRAASAVLLREESFSCVALAEREMLLPSTGTAVASLRALESPKNMYLGANSASEKRLANQLVGLQKRREDHNETFNHCL